MANYRKLSRLIVDVIQEAQTFGGYEGGLSRKQIQSLLLGRGVVLPKYALSKKLWDMRFRSRRMFPDGWSGGVLIKSLDGVKNLRVDVADGVKIKDFSGNVYEGNTVRLEWWKNQQTPPFVESANLNLRVWHQDGFYWAFRNNMVLAGFNRYVLKTSVYKRKTKFGVFDKNLRRVLVWSESQEVAEKLLLDYKGNKKLGF